MEVNGLRIPEPSAAYNLLWEAVSGHDASRDGHLKISTKESLKQLSKHFGQGERFGPGGHAWFVHHISLAITALLMLFPASYSWTN